MHNPYQSPNADGLERIVANSDRHGIDRPMFFFAMLVFVLVYGLFVASMFLVFAFALTYPEH